MNRVSKIVFVAAASLAAMAGTAFAEEPAAGDGAGEGGEGGAAAGGEAMPAPAAGGVSADAGGEVTKANWPLAVIERPLTAAKSMIEISPILGIGHFGSANVDALALAGRYGVSDKLEILAAYQGISLGLLDSDTQFKGALTAGVGYSAIKGSAGGKLDLAVKAGLAYDLKGETFKILAGPDVRYKITPKLYVGTPQNVPGLTITAKGAEVMGVSSNPIDFTIPVAVGFQATPKLGLQLATQLFNIGISDSANSSIADATPIQLDGVFALSNKLDVRGIFRTEDLQNFDVALSFFAGVNYRM
ncbi:MAG: hypothetical protein KF773_16810 [Deltaproteobacteria bacterium]|nr:hypothetical protein [Deltaproteobacteria bacterium]